MSIVERNLSSMREKGSKMKLLFVFGLSAATIFFTQTSLACLPIPQERFEHTRERVKEKFDSVDSVELMTLLDERWVEVPLGQKNSWKILRAKFRVVKVFKGNSKPGDVVIFNSSSYCMQSAVRPWVFIPPGYKIKVRNHPREWLIYRIAEYQTADPDKGRPSPLNEIQDSPMTQPINKAKGEIKFLEELKAKNAAQANVTRNQ